VAGWALAQGIAQVLPVFDTPNWLIRLLVVLIIIGLPIALAMAWAFELTPQGIRRTEDGEDTATRSRGVTWIYIAVVSAILSVALFVLGRYTAPRAGSAESRRSPAVVDSATAKSIAILPFENLSEEKANALCRGVRMRF
jgi:formate hydrogenlyase subunit 3/multisubunit Na+/H+ antiporter MnhD subunit